MTNITPPDPQTEDKPANLLDKILTAIERIGDKLPDPITLFFFLSLAILAISAIAAWANVSVVHPGTQETIQAVSLLTPDGVRRIVTEATQNFITFPPLGVVLVAMLGVGVAEYTGLLAAVLRRLVLFAPARLISPVVVFAGVMSNLASDAGYVVLVPLGAVIFRAFKRHPIAGLAAAFAGVSGGFSANLLIGPTDSLLAGLSQSAAQIIDPNYGVNATANFYFMFISTFLIMLVGWYVTDKIVEPRLGVYQPENQEEDITELAAAERKGLRWAGLSLLAYLAFIAILTLPPQGILRDPETQALIPSPFINGIVFLIAIAFFIPGVVYGKVAGTIQNDRDVAKGLSHSMSSLGYYIALAFIAAQFIAYFSWSNLGVILAINGAELIQASGFTGPPLLILFILLSGFINLFVGSASAKWAIMAPVFIPMLMLVGLSPELTQAAYRIGDSTMNIVTPLMPYFPVVVAFGQRYDRDLGIGKLISLMLPYSLTFLLAWSILFVAWFILNIPLGPGAPIRI